MKIGLLIIATNKYIKFLQNLISSADKWFLPDQQVTYFVFSDQSVSINSKRPVSIIPTEHKPWPWMTLGRYHIFLNSSDTLNKFDYLYYCDVDMLFFDTVGNEILSSLVATQHPLYAGRRGTPETRPESTAYIPEDVTMQYFAGGFNGGESTEYLKMAKVISNNIDTDLNKNSMIAVWHDESHLNRYFVDNKPSKILDSSYCFPEEFIHLFKPKLIALKKNHAEMRNL